MVGLQHFRRSPIQIGDLKRLWIITQKTNVKDTVLQFKKLLVRFGFKNVRIR